MKNTINPGPGRKNFVHPGVCKRSYIFFIALSAMMLFPGKNITAQVLNTYNTQTMAAFEKASIHYPVNPVPVKKRFWRAAGELMLVQLIPWSVNKYVRHKEFANISFESIGYNLKFKNWEWDDNKFFNNQFSHPYHGNLYYNSFRTNGYNFWASSAAAFAGSFIWETCGETHPPAQNDFINTSLGGIALGEMTYRLSQRIFNNRKSGFKRQTRELSGFLVNPVAGFNRIVDGQWGKVYDADPYENAPLAFMMDAGLRRTSKRFEDVIEKGDNQVYTRLRLLYGHPFQDYQKPFSNFSVTAEIGQDDSAHLNALQINGVLHGHKMKGSEKSSNYFFVTMNYDFYNNSSFNYGSQSFAAKFFTDKLIGKKSHLQLSGGAGIIALAAVPNKYLYYGEGRNYDYGSGVTIHGGVGLNIADKLFYNFAYNGAWSKTINGSNSSYFLHTSIHELRLALGKHFSFSVEGGLFQLEGDYADNPDVNDRYNFLRSSLGYRVVF